MDLEEMCNCFGEKKWEKQTTPEICKLNPSLKNKVCVDKSKKQQKKKKKIESFLQNLC